MLRKWLRINELIILWIMKMTLGNFLKQDDLKPLAIQVSRPDENGKNTNCFIGHSGLGASIVCVAAQ